MATRIEEEVFISSSLELGYIPYKVGDIAFISEHYKGGQENLPRCTSTTGKLIKVSDQGKTALANCEEDCGYREEIWQ